MNGRLNSSNNGRLFPQYSNGTIDDVWQNDDVFNGSQNITGYFTTPANVSSFQVGTEVVLDKGFLSFDNLTLTAYSDRIIAVPLTDYRLTTQITGELDAVLGQGGKMWAVYENLAGQTLGSALLWENPANFNGATTMQEEFTPVPLTDKIRIALETNLDAGHLTFDDFVLENLPAAGPIIQRRTYSLAGQAIATKVSGDPAAALPLEAARLTEVSSLAAYLPTSQTGSSLGQAGVAGGGDIGGNGRSVCLAGFYRFW